MARIEVVCACVLALSSAAVSAQDNGFYDAPDGPAPVDSTQSISAGADDDIGTRRDSAAGNAASAAGANNGHASGTYAGVVPGAANKPPPAARAAKKAPTITWPGFQMQADGSSRVFIQSSVPMEAKVLPAANGKYELQFPGARVAAKTNRLPLDTRYFNTPVSKVSVSAARSGAVVQLELRSPVAPKITSELGAAGYFFTYIELPKGEYVKQSASASNNPPPPKPSKVIGPAAPPPAPEPAKPAARSGARRADAKVSGGISIGR
jgi:hypothetical protein